MKEDYFTFIKTGILILNLFLIQQLSAVDYYVLLNGSGTRDGSSFNNAASTSDMITYLKNYTVVETDENTKKLNIYLRGFHHPFPSEGIVFNSADKIRGLEVTMASYPDDPIALIFLGQNDVTISQVKFITMTGGENAEDALKLTLENVYISYFSSTVDAETGAGSLFTLNDYNVLTLKNVMTYDAIAVTSARNPFLCMGNHSSFVASECVFENITTTGANPIFETVAGKTNASLFFQNTEIVNWKTGADGESAHLFKIEDPNTSIEFENVTVRNCQTHRALIKVMDNSSSVQIDNSKFINNQVAGGIGIILNSENHNSIKISDCTFQENSVLTGQSLMVLNGGNGSVSINNSTFNGHAFSTTSSIFRTISSSGNLMIYNNTFSGNGNNSNALICFGNQTGAIVNNTFYNSGGITSSAPELTIHNNLLMTGRIAGSTPNIKRNIFYGAFYEDGITVGQTIANIESYFDPVLKVYKGGATAVHPLILSSTENNPILQKGGKASDTGYGAYLFFDQTGRKRPDLISVGSWDLPDFTLNKGTYTIVYNPEEGLEPFYLIDFTNYIISYPEGATSANTSFEILTQPSNGRLEDTEERFVLKFIPKTKHDNPSEPAEGLLGIPFEMTYRVVWRNASVEYRAEGSLNITIVKNNESIGLEDNDLIRCSDSLNTVDFVMNYLYVSGTYNNVTVPDYYTAFPNTSENKFYGASMPLIGDLDGDGKPEIVALGLANSNTGLAAVAAYLYILNGQNGKVIVKYALPLNWDLKVNGLNWSPSNMVLIDSDNNGRVEIILALGYNILFSNYSKRLISYEVNENTFMQSGLEPENPNKLTLKWNLNTYGTSDLPYDAYGTNNSLKTGYANFAKPVLQVVDLNENGTPEIIVYNKIYNANTGAFIMKLDDLNTNVATSSAFLGQDRYANNGDYDIGFSCIYDIDKDGLYDIAAGGKLYYKISFAEGTSYQTKSIAGLGDGHTAVADINADGIPEIIVCALDENRNNLIITVWDPGLLKWESDNLVPDERPAAIIAQRSVPCYFSGKDGNHSYMVVGDIDRLEQNGKKYPEISVLGPHFFSSNGFNAVNIPVHPNVNDGFLVRNFIYTPGSKGTIISLTWDENTGVISDRLKVSSIIEHQCNTFNTGMVLFDFDNNSALDICYKDKQTFRAISVNKSLVRHVETPTTSPTTVLIDKSVFSQTGLASPVIGDVDRNGNADILVMGHHDLNHHEFGYIYAINSTSNNFPGAPYIWNQYQYSPMKISSNLTTPLKTFDPLSSSYHLNMSSERVDKTYIYNTIQSQTVNYGFFDNVIAPDDTLIFLRPIKLLPDAQILHASIDKETNILHYCIKNNGDATINSSSLISMYKEDEIPSGQFLSVPLENDIFPGDSVIYAYILHDEQINYPYVTIRVLDPSTQTSDLFTTLYVDCNWADNVLEVGDFVLRDVNATVAQYNSVIIDVLGNDFIPDDCVGRLINENIITPGGRGVMDGDFGKIEIINNKLHYTAPAYYNDGIVEITYEITCGNNTRSAKLYIYILESCYSNFAACIGMPYQVCLEKHIPGVTYEWYNENEEFISNLPPYFSDMNEDVRFYVKPKIPEDHPCHFVDFPLGEITITTLPAGAGMFTAKWIGLKDDDWSNPVNWIQIKDGNEFPIQWIPGNCVNVILSTNAPYYPVLNKPSGCANIKIEDRAMIAGINHLSYENAQIEFDIKESEKERFVMWSAPLKSIYTGDYHFGNDIENPFRGDVFMNFFQSTNPDYPGSLATENVFTATFGNLDTELPLGKPFAIYVSKNDYRKTRFIFPRMITSYKYADGSDTQTLDRSSAGKFITDGYLQQNGNMDMPVNGNNSFLMIHVPNPFMAYLDLRQFLLANSSVLEQSYKIWDGKVNSNYITIMPLYDSPDQRLLIDSDLMEDADLDVLLPPLQSFFVLKKPGVQVVNSLNISTSMTTTFNGTNENYKLRNTRNEKNVLRIKLVQDSCENSTVIYYKPGAKAEYSANEDSKKLFNNTSPVSVYTITPDNYALAINSMSDFSKKLQIGLRLLEEGNISFYFSGIKEFGHEIYLVDNLIDKVQKVEEGREYSYYVNLPEIHSMDLYNESGFKEINDRFTLQFQKYTKIDNIEDETDIRLRTHYNTIIIESFGEEMTGFQIYDLIGNKIYSDSNKSTYYEINVIPDRFYLIKINTAINQKLFKAYVK